MRRTEQVSEALQDLLELHGLDRQIVEKERELKRLREDLTDVGGRIATLEASLSQAAAQLSRLRLEARSGERDLDERRDALSRVRSKLNAVSNERQYSAAMLEEERLRREIRGIEEQVLQTMQTIEDTEKRQAELSSQLEEARAGADTRHAALEERSQALEEELAILRDRRENLAIRLDEQARQLYDRTRMGRSEVAMAPLTEEGVCGHCYTAVTSQQQMRIRSTSALICCEGCGVILYPEELDD